MIVLSVFSCVDYSIKPLVDTQRMFLASRCLIHLKVMKAVVLPLTHAEVLNHVRTFEPLIQQPLKFFNLIFPTRRI